MTHALLLHDELVRPAEQKPQWRVLSPTAMYGRVKLYNCSSNQEEWKELSEINKKVVNDELRIRRKGVPRVGLASQPDEELEVALKKVGEALREIKDLQVQHGLSFNKAYDKARAQHDGSNDHWFPSRASAYRYASNKRNGTPMLRGDANKGNRTPRYSPEVVELICDYANGLFLQQDSSWTLRTLSNAINLACRSAGLIAETATISRSFISKTIFEKASVDPEYDRMDPRLAKSAKAVAANRIRVTFPFERVEQDGLHLPMVISTPHGTSSDVWLVHAIDCGTGMPLGQHLCIGAPSASEGLLCAESVFYSKKPLFERLGLDIKTDPHGTPHLYVFDNGPEAKNERMHKLVRLGIDVMHCRSHEGNGKPFIERLNRSLKEALEVLGGSTRKDGKDGARDPVALGDDLMTLEELERWIVRWKYEHWGNGILERHLRSQFMDTDRLGVTPNSRWQRMCGELAFAMPISPSLSDWRRVRFEHVSRTLSRKTGISYEGFTYKGPNLPRLIELFGEQPVEVLVDPDDYRQVFVEVGDDLPPIALTEQFVDESTPAHTFARAKELPKRSEGDVDTAGVQAREKFERDVAAAGAASQGAARAKRKSKAQNNREVKAKAKDSQAVQRAMAQPLATPAAPSEEALPPASVDFGAVAALPVHSRRNGEVQS